MRIHRTLKDFAILCSLFCVMSAMAFDQATAAEGRYRLGTGDKLRIKVFERPDLSGEFRIRPPGNLSLPIIGELRAVGLTPAELERSLAEKLVKVVGLNNPRVNVEMLELRPFFVLGDVQSPGHYPYINGMTVIHAIALAGGFKVLDRQDIFVRIEASRAREKLNLLKDQLGVALARKARLRAELQGADSIDFPDRLSDFFDASRLAEIRNIENRIFKGRKKTLKGEIELLEKQIVVLRQEVAALTSRKVSLSRQVELVKEELDQVSKLSAKGFVPKPRILGLKRIVASLEGQRLQAVAFIAKSRQQIAQVERSILNFRNTRHNDIIESFKTMQDEINRTELSIRETSKFLYGVKAALPRTSARPQREPSKSMTILRSSADGFIEVKADESTLVLPGDVIKVPERLPSGVLGVHVTPDRKGQQPVGKDKSPKSSTTPDAPIRSLEPEQTPFGSVPLEGQAQQTGSLGAESAPPVAQRPVPKLLRMVDASAQAERAASGLELDKATVPAASDSAHRAKRAESPRPPTNRNKMPSDPVQTAGIKFDASATTKVPQETNRPEQPDLSADRTVNKAETAKFGDSTIRSPIGHKNKPLSELVATKFPYGVQLSSHRTPDAARRHLQSLEKKFRDLLGDKKFLIQKVTLAQGSTRYRVRTGFFAERLTAQMLCKAFKARKQNCFMIRR